MSQADSDGLIQSWVYGPTLRFHAIGQRYFLALLLGSGRPCMSMSTRNTLRNAVLNYLPSKVAHRINMLKNVKFGALEAEMTIVPHLVVPGSVVIDVGANLGLYAEIFAEGAKTVVAVEPQPHLAAYLRSVMPGNVEIVEAALSSETGSAKLRVPRFADGKLGGLDAYGTIEPNNSFSTVNVVGVDEFTVPVRRLDDIVGERGPVSLIKIDVEGHEAGVIAGARETIAEHRPMFMIEIEPRLNPSSYDVFDTFSRLGYESYCVHEGRVIGVDRETVADLQRWTGPGMSDGADDPSAPPHVVNFFFTCPKHTSRASLLARKGSIRRS